MSNVRIPMAICAAVNDILDGSHKSLDAMFEAAGAPGPPPDLSHATKWKFWLARASNDPSVDSLSLLGQLIEEFMDFPPDGAENESSATPQTSPPTDTYHKRRDRLVHLLEEHGLVYYRGGRVLPVGNTRELPQFEAASHATTIIPSEVDDLLRVLVSGLPRSMLPLSQRRVNCPTLSFDTEYDVQDLLHALLRPWVADIRPEEFTPSYAGATTRMDFLLPKYKTVIETKRVRDRNHAKKIGDELIIDIEHYRKHTDCDHLWCAVYDPQKLIPNPCGLKNDLDGSRTTPDGHIKVTVHVF